MKSSPGTILQDITLLKYVGVNPIVVHGGGPDINQMLKALDIPTQFHNGLRITDAASMEVVQMVLTGKINKNITAKINSLGAKAIGLCGKDANLIQVVKKRPPPTGSIWGYVGRSPASIPSCSRCWPRDEYIPVIAPVGVGADGGKATNINADTVAGEIAAALAAEKLIFLTDIEGIRRDPKDPGTLISAISVAEIETLLADGTIEGGMIPKVKGCIKSVQMGVNRTHILDGTIPHPLLLEIFTDKGIGTMVTR